MTGMSTKFSEFLQTQSYGIGGHYDIHVDALSTDSNIVRLTGNRIATVLFYVIMLCVLKA